ncbi:MAG: UvrD-helicase domain-containing protein [Proteobacteria bacterium]|nr:UvrD-helicase domain-containing protein [Pseudomonadota bacterium]
MFDLSSELNEQQCQAARHVEGPLLVLAGAGSGKTRVITYRIANLVRNHGVAPWRIMAVTFTNKAAKEMLDRVATLLGEDARCWVSTFHASCARLLRQYGPRMGVDPKFTIYDDQDQRAMVTRVLKELNLSTTQFPAKAVAAEINRAKQVLQGPDEYPQTDFYRRHVQQLYALYEQRMREASALDFGDLLYRTVLSMRADAALAAEIAGMFDFVLVDEFQDTNKVQLELVRMLTPHGNICVVGDDDQSIYSWRGADVTNILEFEKLFPGAVSVTLDRNYRSTQNILSAANGVVSQLAGRRPKNLWTDNAAGERISVMATPDEREEARFVARTAKELAAKGTALSEQAVFYRTNAQSRVLEEVLRAMNIPHRVVGGMRFYERAEVKDIIAYLRLIQNPADHTAFVRVVNTPPRGIGKTTIDRLIELAVAKECSAFDAIDFADRDTLGAAAIPKLAAFKQMVQRWQNEIAEGPFFLAGRVIEDSGYVARLELENTAEADARIENVQELVGSIEDFVADAEEPTLDNFLELITLQTDIDAANFNADQLTLMTVHSAKGLEFNTVFVTGMEEGLFPLVRSEDAVLGDTDAIDEERRLGYVALTRARQKLYITRARERRLYGNTRSNPPSRFIGNIPAAIVRHLAAEGVKTELLSPPSTRRSYGDYRAPVGAGTPFRSAMTPRPAPPRPKTDIWVDPEYSQLPESGSVLVPGQIVGHARFGKGRVVSVQPGANPKVEVEFPAFGRKVLLFSYLEIG